MATTAPSNSANLFTLHGHLLQISYSTSGIDGKPHFQYQDAHQTLNFSGDQIRTISTEIGTLVTVNIRTTIDSGSTSFSLLLPTVNLGQNLSLPLHTIGITTVHKFSIIPALNLGQKELSHATELNGTAQHVVF